jgi:hypothetical protein
VPCGPENLFVALANGLVGETKNNNVGIYICDGKCDFMFSLLDCGWPGLTTKPC